MSPQLNVEDQMERGLPGQLADIGPQTVNSYNNRGVQVDTVTVVAADLETTVTIDGTPFTDNAGGGVKTVAAITDALAVLINAGSEPVVADSDGVDTITIYSTGFENAVVYLATANVTVANVVPFEQPIPFGTLIVQDPNSDVSGINPFTTGLIDQSSSDFPAAGPFSVLGVAISEFTVEVPQGSEASNGYPAGKTMSVLRRGNIYVQVEDAVVAGGKVFARFAASGGNTQLGAFRSDADGGTAKEVAGFRYKDSAAAGEIAILEVDVNNV
jgi:hypothetical protein